MKFRQALTDRAAEFEKIVAARGQGVLHHRFGFGDGYVLVVDEWETAEQFQRFFSDPELQAFIASAGAKPGPPELIVCEAVASPDQF